LLGQTITRVLRGSGRLRQSVAESSFDAWTKFYKQDANASNAIVSYYAKGSLIALCLDLKLRAETDGRACLDDVMKECWRRWGQSGQGMPEDGFEVVCTEVAGADLSDFFDAAVRGTGELPLQTLLRSHGIAYQLRQSNGSTDKGGKPADSSVKQALWLGAILKQENDTVVFSVIMNGGPAERAGIASGDVAVALDGIALTTSNWVRRLGTYHDGDTLDLVVFRDDELITTDIRLVEAPVDTCYLEMIENADSTALSRRAAWLQT
jgi:predicted metalloprotease with PDZ domain